ncbi:hypothetical protein ACIQCS_21430 [Sphingomonas sp. NPDC092440]|jgi:hypothetical protein
MSGSSGIYGAQTSFPGPWSGHPPRKGAYSAIEGAASLSPGSAAPAVSAANYLDDRCTAFHTQLPIVAALAAIEACAALIVSLRHIACDRFQLRFHKLCRCAVRIGQTTMKRRSILALMAVALPNAGFAQSSDDRARAAAAASRAKSSTSDKLLQNYVKPGLAGQPISTVDSSRTFTPSLACQKTATLLELLVQPAASGDLDMVRISRDTNLDGKFDATATLPVPVSGICANGIISCDPGTWNNCHSYRWSVDGSAAPRLETAVMTDLAGCYCINNSCGSGLAIANLPSILKDLGGGVVAALTTADPRYGIAEARIDGPVISYVGAQSTACTASPSVGQTAYRANPAAIAGDAAAAAASSPVFQMLAGSPAATSRTEEVRNCTVRRQVRLTGATPRDVIARTSGGYGDYVSPGGDRITFQMGSPVNNSLTGGSCSLFDFRMRLSVIDPDRLTDIRLTRYEMDDWMQVYIDGQLVYADPSTWRSPGLPSASCDRKTNWQGAPNLDLKPWMTRGDHEIRIALAVGGNGELDAQIDAAIDTSCRASENVVDGCASYAGNAACRLTDEHVDGVATIVNGIRTGLTPLPQTRVIAGGACSLSLARDFFEKERRYRCRVDSGMPDPDTSRGAWIIDHSTEAMLADRTRASDGSYSSTTRNFALPDRGSVSACEPVCKTRRPQTNNAAALDGVTGGKQNTPAGWDMIYHTCQDSNVCPVGDGEELVQGCGCIDDFPEAVVMMQTMRLGGTDLVCTSGPR